MRPLRLAVVLAPFALSLGCGGAAREAPPTDPLLVRYEHEMAEARALRATSLGAPAMDTTIAAGPPPSGLAPALSGPTAKLGATMSGQPVPLEYSRPKRRAIPLTTPIAPYVPSTPPPQVHYGKW